MARYKINFKTSVAKDLRTITNQDVKKILNKIEAISENPRAEGCIKLSGQENYRARQGLYRIVYEIRDEVLIVNVIKVAHRSNVYSKN